MVAKTLALIVERLPPKQIAAIWIVEIEKQKIGEELGLTFDPGNFSITRVHDVGLIKAAHGFFYGGAR